MQSKLQIIEEKEAYFPSKKDQALRRVYSDASIITVNPTAKDLDQTIKPDDDQAQKVECECCGMHEECTPTYISRIKSFFFNRWVCGLCAEAVKEKLRRGPSLSMEEALESHGELCKQFNGTRMNPSLSLAGAMREIARKSSQRRSSANDKCGLPKIGRTMSCVPRIDGC